MFTQLSQEMFDSVGFLTMTKTLFVLKGGAYSMIHGLCDLTIQHVSSTRSSPFSPYIYRIVSVCSVLSEPVGTPVRSCRYLRRKVLPDRGNEQNAILLLLIGSPSRKTPSASNIHLFLSQSASSFDRKSAYNCFKLIAGVVGFALMCPYGSNS